MGHSNVTPPGEPDKQELDSDEAAGDAALGPITFTTPVARPFLAATVQSTITLGEARLVVLQSSGMPGSWREGHPCIMRHGKEEYDAVVNHIAAHEIELRLIGPGGSPLGKGANVTVRNQVNEQLLAREKRVFQKIVDKRVRYLMEDTSHLSPIEHGKEPLIEGLNPSQARAVDRATYLRERQTLAWHGPPGTGKTKAIVEYLRAAIDANYSILVTAQTHAVVDQILSRLGKSGTDPDRIVRLVSDHTPEPSREIGRQVHVDDVSVRVKSGIVVGCTVDQLIASIARQSTSFWHYRFDTAVVDEAGLQSDRRVAILKSCAKYLLLVGDPQQTGPIVQGERQQTSYLETLIRERDDLVCFLDTQYRSHQAVVEWSNEELYAGRIQSDARLLEKAPSLGGHRLAGINWVTGYPAGEDQKDTTTGSWYNLASLEASITLIEKLRQDWHGTIAYIAPFKAQVQRMRRKLRQAPEHVRRDVVVGTIEAFQGKEADVVLIDLTTSQARMPHKEKRAWQRFNVAITRGRYAAVILNPNDSILLEAEVLQSIHRHSRTAHLSWDAIE